MTPDRVPGGGPSGGDAPAGWADDARRYRLDSRIATGGMGEVWRGRDTVLDRPVAVKVLKAEYADDTLFRTRFETEARHAGSLHHPGIASVFDYGEASPTDGPLEGAGDGSGSPRPYLVMELVDGQPLNALLRPHSPMDPDAARDLLGQAAAALGAAHAAGIVHRDVKPANLIITPDRRVKVTDFGIARATEGMALTQTGQVMGTPQYLSPEQAEGRQVTPASDVYSLGVVAYECLAGRRPFVAESPVATALAHVREPVPDLPPEVPGDLATVVRRALAKDPADRWADGVAFAAALGDPAAAVAAMGGAGATVASDRTVADAPATRVMGAAGAGALGAGAVAGAAGAAGAGGVAAARDVDHAEGDPASRRRRGLPTWLPWLLLLVVIVLAAALVAWATDEEPTGSGSPQQPTGEPTQSPTATEPTSEPTTDPPSEPTEPTSEPTTQEPETVTIDEDDYIGRDREEVEAELEELGLRPKGEEVDNDGSHEEGEVASVEPDGTLEEGSEVTVSWYGKPPEDDEPLDDLTDGNQGNGNGGGNDSGSDGNNGEGNG